MTDPPNPVSLSRRGHHRGPIGTRQGVDDRVVCIARENMTDGDLWVSLTTPKWPGYSVRPAGTAGKFPEEGGRPNPLGTKRVRSQERMPSALHVL
jgi:hypothetical protein